MSNVEILEQCKRSISQWQVAFNLKNAAGCAKQYKEEAVMEAKPFGVFKGREAIQAFWQGIIDQGFSDVEYTDVEWTKADDEGFILTANWTMNKAYGVVHHEHWVIDEDGEARLILDRFEVLGEK